MREIYKVLYERGMNKMDNDLLSEEALKWLSSVSYCEKTHEERMALISAARIAYPDNS